MTTIRLKSDRVIHSIVSRNPEVRRAVREAAQEIGERASQRLASHTNTGDTTISVEHGRTDSFVSLDDTRGQRAALSIEFGHTAANGRRVDGLHVLYRAAGLI